MKFKNLFYKRNTDLEQEEKIKIKFNSKKRKALMCISVVLITGFIGTYTVLEYVRSQNSIILATTTSTYDSGLLDYLLPVFERRYKITVDVISVGTGEALEAGKNGDADVLLVHERESEDQFIEDDYGVNRACVMYNDFLLIGPTSDVAGIKNTNITGAMSKLKKTGDLGKIKFYSRGDNSGTHIKELKLWKLIGFTPDTSKDDWYYETGTGMGDTLTTTNNNKGYTLIDRGTWLSRKEKVNLIDLVYGTEILLNPYGAIAINPDKHPNAQYEHAITFISFLVSEEGQDLIKNYRKEGEVLFYPCFGICDETHGCDTTKEEIKFWKNYNGGYEKPSSESSLITRSFPF